MMIPSSCSTIGRSLWYDRRINVALLLGVACAGAVLTGALLVGDSMRGSLKALTLDRLGRVDTVLLCDSFFSTPHDDFATNPGAPWVDSMPAILLDAAVELNGKISDTQILGLERDPQSGRPLMGGLVVNRALADRLGANAGETVSFRFRSLQAVPSESSLGRKNDLILRARLPIQKIVPNRGIGRFSLQADQKAEPLAIVPLEWLQGRLGVNLKINALFFLTAAPEIVSSPEQRERLENGFHPTLADLGITVDRKANQAYIKTERMFFTESQAAEIQASLPGARPGLLYLATSIKAVKNGRETPYSTVFASDFIDIGAEHSVKRPDRPSPPCAFIALNRWTADDLDVTIGDEIELNWFAPENVDETRSKRFRLTALLPMDRFGGDPALVPDVKGMTDEASIADWDPPFPFDAKKIRRKDEDYWDEYRAAPKAFLSLETGKELWKSRFGEATTFWVAKERDGTGTWEREWGRGLKPSTFGFTFFPAKSQGLSASAGTTPFSILFLSFSFFIIASALMLVAMLFRLSVEMKAKRIGILLAVGWTRRQIARMLLAEATVVASVGSLIGAFSGILYARLMIYGLTTWWVEAVTVPFLTLHVTPWSLVFGSAGGVVMALSAIALTLFRIRRFSVKSLLDGRVDDVDENMPAFSNRRPFRPGVRPAGCIAAALCGLTIGILYFPFRMGLDPAPWFFLLGAAWLLGGLFFIRERTKFSVSKNRFIRSLSDFAYSNAARNRGRSVLCIGLVASTTFLVLSIGAFRLDPSNESGRAHSGKTDRKTGDGGFALIGETAFPVHHDPGTFSGREELGIQKSENDFLLRQRLGVHSFRLRDGDDAGCLNLYQPEHPRILGVPASVAELDPFVFVRSPDRYPEKGSTVKRRWEALMDPVSTDPDGARRVPVVLDANTAMYSLHLYGGIGDVYETDDGRGGRLRFEVAGLLGNSVLQGVVLMSEENLISLFPDVDGYRFFLFDRDGEAGSDGPDDRTVKILYEIMGDYGFRAETTTDRLRKLYAVQNTYLSTFQSLGGIGLLLGTFGLAVLQCRNVFERRRELALLQAIGFTRRRVVLLLLDESCFLLFQGLTLALLASCFALLPFFLGLAVQPIGSEAIVVSFVRLVGGMTLIGILSTLLASFSVLGIPVARELAEEF